MDDINAEKVANTIVNFIKTSFSKAGFSRGVIGLSGGLDSAVSCMLIARALGNSNIFPLLLPCGFLNTQGVLDSVSFIETLQIPRQNITRVDIEPIVRDVIKSEPGIDAIRRGNIMARVRMIILFDQAKKRQALVVGTENKSEHLLGYFTRYGDEASDIEPLRNLYKTQVYILAKHLRIPETILAKPPTAGLWDGQTDEGEFGFTYKDGDQILSLLCDEKKSVDETVAMGFNRGVVEKVKNRVEKNAFKQITPLVL
jgi:NAD+ synthase